MSDVPSILDELLGDLSVGSFLDQNYLKLPFARAGGAQSLVSLARWETAARLLQQSGVDLLIGRGGSQWTGDGSPTPDLARELMDQGYTIGFRHAERHDPTMSALADRFRDVQDAFSTRKERRGPFDAAVTFFRQPKNPLATSLERP